MCAECADRPPLPAVSTTVVGDRRCGIIDAQDDVCCGEPAHRGGAASRGSGDLGQTRKRICKSVCCSRCVAAVAAGPAQSARMIILVWLAVHFGSQCISEASAVLHANVEPHIAGPVRANATSSAHGRRIDLPMARRPHGGRWPRHPLYEIRATRPDGKTQCFVKGKEVALGELLEDAEDTDANASFIEDGVVYTADVMMSLVLRSQQDNATLPAPMDQDVQRLLELIANASVDEDGAQDQPQPVTRQPKTLKPVSAEGMHPATGNNHRTAAVAQATSTRVQNGSCWNKASAGAPRSRSRSEGGGGRRTYLSVSVAGPLEDLVSRTEVLSSKPPSAVSRESRARQRSGDNMPSKQSVRSVSVGAAGGGARVEGQDGGEWSWNSHRCWEAMAASAAALRHQESEPPVNEREERQAHVPRTSLCASAGGGEEVGFAGFAPTPVQAPVQEVQEVQGAAAEIATPRMMPGVFSVQEIERGIMFAGAHTQQHEQQHEHAFMSQLQQPASGNTAQATRVAPAAVSAGVSADKLKRGTMSLQAVEQLLGAAAVDVAAPRHHSVGPAGLAPSASTPVPAPALTHAPPQPTPATGRHRAGAWGAEPQQPGTRQDGSAKLPSDAQRTAHVRHTATAGAPLTAQNPVPPAHVVAAADRAMAMAQAKLRRREPSDPRPQANAAWDAGSSLARASPGPAQRTRHARQDGFQAAAAPVPPPAVVAAAAEMEAAAKRAALPPPCNPWATTTARPGPAAQKQETDLDLSGDFPALAAAAKPARSSASKAGARRASAVASKEGASSSSWGSAQNDIAEEDEGGGGGASGGAAREVGRDCWVRRST